MATGTYIIAIDVGIKNLGLCVFDFKTNSVTHWDNISLVPNGRYIPAHNVQYVRNFVKQYQHFFDNLYMVVIERQMRCNMRIVEAILQSMFYERCIIISARSVKLHYNLSTKNYKSNKAKAVAWVKQFVQNNPQAFSPGVQIVFSEKNKQDDLADALLLVLYYLDTYSNQLTNNVTIDNVRL